MTLTAYHKHLLTSCNFDRDVIATNLVAHCMDRNPQAFDLVNLIDKEYINLTFFKAADLLLAQAKIEGFEPEYEY